MKGWRSAHEDAPCLLSVTLIVDDMASRAAEVVTGIGLPMHQIRR